MKGRASRKRWLLRRIGAAFVAVASGTTALVLSTGGVAWANTLTIPAQGANTSFSLQPGNLLYAGYDFQYPGVNCGITSNYPPQKSGGSCPSPLPLTSFSNISIRIDIACQDKTTPNPTFVTINPADQIYDGTVGDNGWYPSGTQKSDLIYQGSVAMPSACNSTSNHTMVQGSNMGPLTAEVQTQQNPPPSMQARFHYGSASDLGSNGGTGTSFSGTASVTPDLNPNISGLPGLGRWAPLGIVGILAGSAGAGGFILWRRRRVRLNEAQALGS